LACQLDLGRLGPPAQLGDRLILGVELARVDLARLDADPVVEAGAGGLERTPSSRRGTTIRMITTIGGRPSLWCPDPAGAAPPALGCLLAEAEGAHKLAESGVVGRVKAQLMAPGRSDFIATFEELDEEEA